MLEIALFGRLGVDKYAQVDDYLPVMGYSWHVTPDGYAAATIKGRYTLMHRLIMEAQLGQVVDHINGNRLDNRRANLRFVTNSQNLFNSKPRQRNKSGFKGVCYVPRISKYRARIAINKQDIHLGYFLTREDAARAYDVAAKRYFGEYAYLNFL